MNTKYKFILLFFLLFMLGCQAKAQKEKAEEVFPVKVRRVEVIDFADTLDYVGNIKAQDEVIVYPKVSGKIIEKTKDEGDSVVKNETIAYIDRDETGLKFEKAPVESPLSGIIGKVYVDIGTNVSPQAPIALVVNMQKMKIGLDIPEKYLAKVALGQNAKIKVDAYPEEEFLGKVTKISPIIDLANRAFSIEITVDNGQLRLKSGMFARVSLVVEEKKRVPVILKEAVMGKDSYLYVFVIENNKAKLKKLVAGLRQGPYLEVKEGLSEGDSVVIIGQQRLYEGASVSVEEEKQ